MIFAVLPVKAPGHSKQRLSAMLGAPEREALARLLFERMMANLLAARGLDRILVVTSDETTARHARRAGAMLLAETRQLSHSHSAVFAARRALEMGASSIILLPIDVPLATAGDIEQVVAATRAGVVIVPSSDGAGTNVLALTPPGAIEARFGPNSFSAHMEQAREHGLNIQVLRPPGLVFDLDTPEDAAELMARAPQSPVAELLRSFHIPCK